MRRKTIFKVPYNEKARVISKYLVKGLSDIEIAKILDISPSTVYRYRKILEK